MMQWIAAAATSPLVAAVPVAPRGEAGVEGHLQPNLRWQPDGLVLLEKEAILASPCSGLRGWTHRC